MEVPRDYIGSASPKDERAGDRTKGVCSVLHTELGGLGKRTEDACSVLQTGTKGVGRGKGKCVSVTPDYRSGAEDWGSVFSVTHMAAKWRRLEECVECYTQSWTSGGKNRGIVFNVTPKATGVVGRTTGVYSVLQDSENGGQDLGNVFV